MKNSAYLPIITFSALAFVFSYTLGKIPLPSPSGIDLRDIACGFGPLLSGHLCYLLLKRRPLILSTENNPYWPGELS